MTLKPIEHNLAFYRNGITSLVTLYKARGTISETNVFALGGGALHERFVFFKTQRDAHRFLRPDAAQNPFTGEVYLR